MKEKYCKEKKKIKRNYIYIQIKTKKLLLIKQSIINLKKILVKIVLQKKKCGKKRFRPNKYNKEHNKFSDDNIIRRCKHLVRKNVLQFIINQIKKEYNGNIGKGIFKKELHIINQS